MLLVGWLPFITLTHVSLSALALSVCYNLIKLHKMGDNHSSVNVRLHHITQRGSNLFITFGSRDLWFAGGKTIVTIFNADDRLQIPLVRKMNEHRNR